MGLIGCLRRTFGELDRAHWTPQFFCAPLTPPDIRLLLGIYYHIKLVSAMKVFWSPDLIVSAALAGILVSLVCALGWPLLEADGWRVFLLATIPIFHAGFSFLWIARPRFRLFAYRLYYMVFGHKCDVQILGTVSVHSSWDDATVLNAALRVAQRWRSDAKETLRSSNRSVIQASGRTITVSVVGDQDEDDEGTETLEEDALDPNRTERQIIIDLRGYEDKLTRTDAALHSEVHALLESFATEMCRAETKPNFTLRAHIRGTNPFLAFYLRDVPIAHIDNFQLEINAREFGNDVTVTVRSDLITVAAHSPRALVESARRYLATPAVANLN